MVDLLRAIGGKNGAGTVKQFSNAMNGVNGKVGRRVGAARMEESKFL
jgi:hypothetical protein